MVGRKISQLTSKQILEKEFKSSFKGYSPDEVDKFLDVVIKDYDQFQQRIQELEQENTRLKKEAQQNTEKQTRQAPAPGNTNYDILKRLSNLEKHVFGNKLFD